MKYLIIFLMVSCSPHHTPQTKYSLPSELKDCKIFLISDGVKELYVVKCPNADTTTSWTRSCGKNCTTTEHAMVTR
jgi:hypothetical protein